MAFVDLRKYVLLHTGSYFHVKIQLFVTAKYEQDLYRMGTHLFGSLDPDPDQHWSKICGPLLDNAGLDWWKISMDEQFPDYYWKPLLRSGSVANCFLVLSELFFFRCVRGCWDGEWTHDFCNVFCIDSQNSVGNHHRLDPVHNLTGSHPYSICSSIHSARSQS